MDNIGNVLRQARIDKGMTIDDLQKKTRIQKRYLIAIENGDFDQLPGQFYVRAFIKQYGEYVGVDTDSFFNHPQRSEYQDSIDDKYEEETEEYKEFLHDKSQLNTSPYLTRQQPKSRWHSLIPQILVIVSVASVIFVVWFFAQKSHKSSGISDQGKVTSIKSSSVSKSHEVDQKANESSSASSGSSKRYSSNSSSSSSSNKQSSKVKEVTKVELKSQNGTNYTYSVTGLKSSGNNLTLSAVDGNSWDKVSIGNTSPFAGSLKAGQNQIVEIPKGTTNITVTLGATSYSKVMINDQEVDLSSISSPGVSNLIFNIENKEDTNEFTE